MEGARTPWKKSKRPGNRSPFDCSTPYCFSSFSELLKLVFQFTVIFQFVYLLITRRYSDRSGTSQQGGDLHLQAHSLHDAERQLSAFSFNDPAMEKPGM
jgi:hypothetical protein